MSKQRDTEFVALVAIMSSLGALSIDAVLPALPQITESFNLLGGDGGQLIIGVLLLGMTLGQLVYGPLSDHFGRRPILFIGVALFMSGSLVSVLAGDFYPMLAGRFLQGVGAAALRIVPLAIVRDRYEGPEMARIMSLALSFFILVPCIAPILGQGIVSLADWRAIFWLLFGLSCVVAGWVWLRQPETLSPDKRRAGGFAPILEGLKTTLSNRVTCTHMIALGLIQGVFIGYVLSAEQIYRAIFSAGELFAFYFALAAVSIGLASVLNARLVKRFGLQDICRLALFGVVAVSGLMVLLGQFGTPHLGEFLAAISAIFFCFGLLMGNMNAIALQPLGHIAGLANSIISFLSGCIALAFGSLIGGAFNMSVQPLMLGAIVAGLLSMVALAWGTKALKNISENPVQQAIPARRGRRA
ncbi:multidrug effflux MFS transporter [Microbulbifer sp. 2304DJ12-6]|uniref:multidrug effflux MFS transporter n=1 Tax=Microbulbifer sp. 2304DJ12-6 TaxID=3233340 RepID=UPI0039AFDFDF